MLWLGIIEIRTRFKAMNKSFIIALLNVYLWQQTFVGINFVAQWIHLYRSTQIVGIFPLCFSIYLRPTQFFCSFLGNAKMSYRIFEILSKIYAILNLSKIKWNTTKNISAYEKLVGFGHGIWSINTWLRSLLLSK